MQKCDLTGKGKQYGNNVSFSQRRTRKVWKPNLQTKTLNVDGVTVTPNQTMTINANLEVASTAEEVTGRCS